MRADVIIIGGGLASLVAGIKLLRQGLEVIIVSAGQSALHFSSGSLGLLSTFRGQPVSDPLDVIDRLEATHPYLKVGGRHAVERYLTEAHSIMAEAGIRLKGQITRNHYKLTPFGVFSPAWLTLNDHLTVDDPEALPWHSVSLIGIKGFLDFYPEFIKEGLNRKGVDCTVSEVALSEFDILRLNPTEMRAPNIARILKNDTIDRYAMAINSHIGDADIAVVPAVIGMNSYEPVERLREKVNCELFFVATTPTAVPGIRMQLQLHHHFKKLGGWYLLGDQVVDGTFDHGRLTSVNTANLRDTTLEAEEFILATGSFFSHGLRATPTRIVEPIFDLDVDYPADRMEWYNRDVFGEQPFMKIGVRTDEDLRCCRGCEPIQNLHAIGGIVGGSEPLHEGTGAGTALATALFVTDRIMKGHHA